MTKILPLITVLGFVLISSTFVVNAQRAYRLPPPPPAIYKVPGAADLVCYESPEKNFEIVFPGKPDHKEVDGDSAKTSVAFTGNNAGLSIVSVYDYKANFPVEKDRYLESYRARILSREKTKIDDEISVETNGIKGTEFKIDNYYEYEVRRVFIINNRVFELKSAAANWHTIGEKTKAAFLREADRFMNSFKILGDAH